MTPYQRRLNPYIQRMVEDMQLRNLAESTIDAYTYHVDKFCQHSANQRISSARKKSANTNTEPNSAHRREACPSLPQLVN